MKFLYASGDRPLEGYTIRRGIGRGGFGEVYHAVSDGGKEVALKLVQRHLDVELRGVGQCLNLKHPNLVDLYDLRRTADGDHWVVMEYLAGESLAQVLARHKQGLPPAEAERWLRGVCEGVGYLHEQGLVHRDLKPGNIFLEEGVVKVGDYGLSKFISTSRRSGQTESIGTVHYIAPEVSCGRYGLEIDLYALGVLFYEMLTGRPPFEGETAGEILMKHLTSPPDLRPVPAPYRAVVARLLEKNPRRRYRSVGELLADLDGSRRGLGRVEGSGAASAACGPARPALRYDAEPSWHSGHDSGVLGIPVGFRSVGRAVSAVCDGIQRHVLVAFLGVGGGMLAAGVSLMLSGRRGEDRAAFIGVGTGFLVSGLSACKLFRAPDGRLRWRLSIGLLLGVGVGMLVGGLASSASRPGYDDHVPFLAVGAGFLTTALTVAFLLNGRVLGATRPRQQSAWDDSEAGLVSRWFQPVRRRHRPSVTAKLVWVSLGILLLFCLFGLMGASTRVHEVQAPRTPVPVRRPLPPTPPPVERRVTPSVIQVPGEFQLGQPAVESQRR
jgi:hypothetical protein